MQMQSSRKQESAEDIFFGQVVMIWARWFIILAGVIYALWLSTDTFQLSIAILLLAIIMGVNFFVHGRYLIEKPINRALLLTLSAVDLVTMTIIILAGPGESGLQNHLFIFYYPLLLAFAFVFPPAYTAAYTVITLVAYAFVCVLIDPFLALNGPSLELLVMRLITLAAIGGLGTYYWRIQRDRRRAIMRGTA